MPRFIEMLPKAYTNICVHGFRVQRFKVSFLVKPDGINESRRNSKLYYSAILRMNQPAVP